MIRETALAAALLCAGCVTQYHPSSEYPATPDRFTANVICDREAHQAQGLTRAFGLIGDIVSASTIQGAYDRCMSAHGWVRS